MLSSDTKHGRYLLFLDILGFTELVSTSSAEEIYAVVDDALQAFSRWEELNQLFRTIYFSDTFIFYQYPKGYGDWAFLDAYAVGGMVFSALLARHIPARGAIAFGEFEVREDSSRKHQVYFGRAFVEAYRAEKKENWIGISILRSAWEHFDRANPGAINAFAQEGAWLRRRDDILLLNPFIKLRAWYPSVLIGEVDRPYKNWGAPEFPNDLMALAFIDGEAKKYADAGDFTGKVAAKYHATVAVLRRVMGREMYDWALSASTEL